MVLLIPPATRILPLGSSVAVCTRSGLTRFVVDVQVTVPFQSSALAIDVVPFDEPPATSTCPSVKIPVGSSVAVWPHRRAISVPAEGNVGVEPLAGIVNTKLSSIGCAVPALPPVIKTFPFASFVAV